MAHKLTTEEMGRMSVEEYRNELLEYEKESN